MREDDHRLGRVVEPDDREVVRNGEAALVRSVQCADRHVVVEPEDRRRRIGERQQLLGRLHAPRRAPVGVGDQVGVEQDARCGKRRTEAVQPFLGCVPAGSTGDRPDPPVAEREEMLGGELRAGRVHGGDARDPVGRCLSRIDDDERKALRLQ